MIPSPATSGASTKPDSSQSGSGPFPEQGAPGTENNNREKTTPPRPALAEKQRRELWLYLAVSIVAVELLLTVGAVFYGFMSMGSDRRFVFPWLSWAAAALVCPSLILLLAHFADVGLFRPPGGAASEQEWQRHLPERMQRLYRIIKGAPVIVVLLGIVLLGAALMTLDGALSALMRLGSALVPYIPHIVAGVAVFACAIVLAAVWLSYRTRRLMAEYDFRREVLEKTGVIIVDKGSVPLPPGGVGASPYAPYALEAGQEQTRALPEAEIITAEARVVPQGDDAPENKAP